MATENPKISSYVPKTIYDAFKKFQKAQKLSMSQAIIVILAEYLGVKEYSKNNVVGGVTLEALDEIKGKIKEIEDIQVSPQEVEIIQEQLKEFNVVKKKLESLEKRIDYLETKDILPTEITRIEKTKTISEPLIAIAKEKEDNKAKHQKENGSLQLNLLSEPQEIKLEAKHLSMRLSSENIEVSLKKISSRAGLMMKKDSIQAFRDWTRELDPNNIAWDIFKNPNGRKGSKNRPVYYYLPYKPNEEELKLLREWINKNLSGETPSMAVKNIEANDSQSQKPRRGRRGAKRNGEG